MSKEIPLSKEITSQGALSLIQGETISETDGYDYIMFTLSCILGSILDMELIQAPYSENITIGDTTYILSNPKIRNEEDDLTHGDGVRQRYSLYVKKKR